MLRPRVRFDRLHIKQVLGGTANATRNAAAHTLVKMLRILERKDTLRANKNRLR